MFEIVFESGKNSIHRTQFYQISNITNNNKNWHFGTKFAHFRINKSQSFQMVLSWISALKFFFATVGTGGRFHVQKLF